MATQINWTVLDKMSPFADYKQLDNKEAVFILQVQTKEGWLSNYVAQTKELRKAVLALYLVNENVPLLRNDLINHSCRLVYSYLRSEQLRVGIVSYIANHYELNVSENTQSTPVPVNLDFS